ncbi:uncharacterized protein GIQ15_02127 [Arthroderma uncinatum]|uniref:uncharacterized protein n=1 Tax=Arthroderma uncinatum TaxID=74035 RepID=UPI00144A6C3D|nr:uncharacterized protein GIQ15_02127 [Arthroderma uncinatum]KAF3482803.1 hypothetical protein GIQ15_02127 [Arthroderma uncinatum]
MKGATTPPPGPFGYALISPQDTPFDSAPERPPGPALLDDSESNMLDNLFTSLNASQFDSNDFWLSLGDQGDNAEPGTGSNFSWPDLPPTFEGSTTTLPTQQSHHIHSSKQSREMAAPDRSGTLSSDVLAAAQMLYQNGHDHLSALNSQIYTDHGLLDHHHAHSSYHSLHGQHQQQQQHHHQLDAKRAHFGRYNGDALQKDFVIPKGIHTSTMIFDHAVNRTPASDHQTGPGAAASSMKLGSSMLQWGSDSGFAHQGYRLPPGQPTAEETTENLLHNLECLEAQSSAANTRPSSPVRKLSDRHGPDSSFAAPRNPNSSAYEDRPKKRRKSNNKIKEEDTELVSALSTSKYPSTATTTSSTFARPSSSRKSKGISPNGGNGNGTTIKASRENLSEEQKRTNHILSEQKRRNLIKQGFDDLCSLVPELKGGGYSKSTMLTQAGDWLADLLAGNELLKAQLADLKARGG